MPVFTFDKHFPLISPPSVLIPLYFSAISKVRWGSTTPMRKESWTLLTSCSRKTRQTHGGFWSGWCMGIYPHTAVWTCCSHEMSLSWWEGNINLFTDACQHCSWGGECQKGTSKCASDKASAENCFSIQLSISSPLPPFWPWASIQYIVLFIHSVLIQFLPCSGIHRQQNPQVPPYGASSHI